MRRAGTTLPSRVPWVKRLAVLAAILVLNGHNDEKVPSALPWLDMLPTLPNLQVGYRRGVRCLPLPPLCLAVTSPCPLVAQNVGLLVLGYEDCSNAWLERYIADPRYKIRFLFLVYGGQVAGACLADCRCAQLKRALGQSNSLFSPRPYFRGVLGGCDSAGLGRPASKCCSGPWG